MSSYHIDQLGRVVKLLIQSDRYSCNGCMYGDALSCVSTEERPVGENNQRASCVGGIFVEVTHE